MGSYEMNLGIRLFRLKSIDREELEGSIFITGYQGFGMVGYLTSKHISLQLGLERIAFIRTRYFPEATLYDPKIGILYPFELYYGRVDGKKLLVLVNHGIPHVKERTNYAEFIGKLVSDLGVSETILVGGLDPAVKEREDEEYRWIPIGNTRHKLNAPILDGKHVIGPLALTMMFINAYGIPGVAIFSYAELYRPDPKATIVAVKTISKILGVSIPVDELEKEASVIEEAEEKSKEFLSRLTGEVRSEKTPHEMYM